MSKFKVGDQFEVTSTNLELMPHHHFKIGDVIVLVDDDGTSEPRFRRTDDGLSQYVNFRDLTPLEVTRT